MTPRSSITAALIVFLIATAAPAQVVIGWDMPEASAIEQAARAAYRQYDNTDDGINALRIAVIDLLPAGTPIYAAHLALLFDYAGQLEDALAAAEAIQGRDSFIRSQGEEAYRTKQAFDTAAIKARRQFDMMKEVEGWLLQIESGDLPKRKASRGADTFLVPYIEFTNRRTGRHERFDDLDKAKAELLQLHEFFEENYKRALRAAGYTDNDITLEAVSAYFEPNYQAANADVNRLLTELQQIEAEAAALGPKIKQLRTALDVTSKAVFTGGVYVSDMIVEWGLGGAELAGYIVNVTDRTLDSVYIEVAFYQDGVRVDHTNDLLPNVRPEEPTIFKLSPSVDQFDEVRILELNVR